MPKRAPSPKIKDPDEPHQLVVINPYPGRCTLDTEADRISTARWISCTIGKDLLLALFHRPGAENQIIVEVKKNCSNLERLLGGHEWGKFLKDPLEKEKKNVSKVFFCRMKTARDVEKGGWKRIFVEERWFKDWHPSSSIFIFPYPKSFRCEVPAGSNPVHLKLALNLPVAMFPPLPPNVEPPVGSPAWVATKDVTPVKRAKKTPAKPPNIVMPAPSRPANSVPPVLLTRGSSSIGSSAPSVPPGNTWAAVPPSVLSPYGPNATPPGLVRTGSSPGVPAPPPISRMPSNTPPPPALSASFTSSEEGDWWAPGFGTIGGADDNFSPAVADDPGRFERAMAQLALGEECEHDDDDAGCWRGGGDPPMDAWPTAGPSRVRVVDSLWDADEDTGPAEDPDKVVCTEHGTTCKRGICQVYSKQLRERAKEVQRAERELAAKTRREKKGKGRGDGGADAATPEAADEDGDTPRKHPRARDVKPKIDAKAKPAQLQAASRQANLPPFVKESRQKPPHLPERAKPPHLQKTQAGGQPSAAVPTPSRGPAPTGTWATGPRAPSPAETVQGGPREGDDEGTVDGWPDGTNPWASKKGSRAENDETRSVAATEQNGWGEISEGPWVDDGLPPVRAKNVARNSRGDWRNASDGAWETNGAPRARDASVAPSSGSGWGNVSEGPWKGANAPIPRERSVAPSSRGGWGNVSEGPWKDNHGRSGPPTREPSVSAASSSRGGWGNVSEGPWKNSGSGPSREPSVSPSSRGGWGSVSEGPWKDEAGARSRASSIAPSTRGGWGDVSVGPWGDGDGPPESGPSSTPAAQPSAQAAGTQSKRWADYPEGDTDDFLADDTRSVAASSTTGGWGSVSEGPWGGR